MLGEWSLIFRKWLRDYDGRRRLYDLFWRRGARKERRRGRKTPHNEHTRAHVRRDTHVCTYIHIKGGWKRENVAEGNREWNGESERAPGTERERRKWLVVTHARFFRQTAFLKIFPPVAACRFKSPGRSRRFSNAPNTACLHFVTTRAAHCNSPRIFYFPFSFIFRVSNKIFFFTYIFLLCLAVLISSTDIQRNEGVGRVNFSRRRGIPTLRVSRLERLFHRQTKVVLLQMLDRKDKGIADWCFSAIATDTIDSNGRHLVSTTDMWLTDRFVRSRTEWDVLEFR